MAEHSTKGKAIFVLAVLVGVAALAWWRIGLYAELDPRMDQAFQIDWVQSIAASERILPQRAPGEGWLAALEGDSHSLLHAVLKPIYVTPVMLFNTVSIAWFSLDALTGEVTVTSQMAWSILAQSLMLVFLALMPFGARVERDSPFPYGAGALAVLLAGASSYLHVFAPLGAHNVGIMGLVGGSLVVGRYLRAVQQGGDDVFRWRVFAVLAQALTCYAMYTNVFLLPVGAVFGVVLFGGVPFRRRVVEAIWFSLWTFATFSPAIVLKGITTLHPHAENLSTSFGGLAKFVFNLQGQSVGEYLVANFLSWFHIVGVGYSGFGIALGLLGVVVLAAHYRQALPLSIVLAHMTVWTVMGGFGAQAGQHSRTTAYVIPFLALGGGVLIMAVVSWLRDSERRLPALVATGVVIVGAGLHVAYDAPRLADPKRVAAWSWYYWEQGGWRKMVARLDAETPDGAIIVPWDQRIAYTISVLTNPHANDRLIVFSQLQTLLQQTEAGRLDAYLARRKRSLPAGAPVYVIGPDRPQGRSAMEGGAQVLCHPALMACNRIETVEIAPLPTSSQAKDALVLYRLDPK